MLVVDTVQFGRREMKKMLAGNPRKWRYTWEAPSHIPTIRLFLFTHEIKPLTQCKNLKVTLHLQHSLILVSWVEEEIENQNHTFFDFSLRVPVPRILVDVSSPVDFKLMQDHIEVKLVLLLPVDHPLFMNFDSIMNISGEESNCTTPSHGLLPPLSVGSDIKLLSAEAGVHIFCKSCSMKVTKCPLRSFVEMPSADWREVADNWFGTCCCSFGGISEKLVKQYANSYLLSKGACLLDASCVVVSNGDLADDVFPTCFGQSKEDDSVCDPVGEDLMSESAVATGSNGRESLFSENPYECTSADKEKAKDVFPGCFDQSKDSDSVCDPVGEGHISESVVSTGSNGRESLFCENLCESTSVDKKSIAISQMFDIPSEADENLRCISLEKERLTSNLKNEATERENCAETSPCISPTMSDISGNTESVHMVSANDWNHCCRNAKIDVSNHDCIDCSDDIFVASSNNQKPIECITPLKNQESLLNVSLGNGFMVRHSNLSKDVDWMELKCPQCSSVLGAYPSTKDIHAPADGGVRLFKCYISTGLPYRESDDIFRNYTLHGMFINQLMESAQDDLSFRTVVRDLRTRSPLLQIVLLNSNAWSCTGYCLEMEDIVKTTPKIDLHPIIKVLFSDSSNDTEAESRTLDKWSTKNQAEEVFMFRHQVNDLIEALKSAMSSLPLSCSYMQGMSLSFIEK